MNYPLTRRSVSLGERVSPSVAPTSLTQLENWQLRRHLGTGASAQVWLLEHLVSKQQLACKVPKGTDDCIQLSQEAKLAQTLRHENLVRISDAHERDDLTPARHAGVTFWEFLPAGSLGALIGAGGALSIAQTVTVLLPMIQVAEYLQSQHIVHGDLSPSNILFDLDGRPVLIDLGTVRATAHAYHTTGTPGFVAPEINDSQEPLKGLGAAADVYSLAAIGWFCLTAASPGLPHGRMPLGVLQPAVDREIVEVLEACLTSEPALRPSPSQLRDAVAGWAVPEPVDLFASVGEEYELLLPTRKPREKNEPRRQGFKRTRSKRTAQKNTLPTLAKRSRRSQTFTRRLYLGIGSCGLLATVVGTSLYVDLSLRPDREVTQMPVQGSGDFQAAVDELAKARSQAWEETDPSQVGRYAAQGSEIFEDDSAVLTELQENGTVLDGIRMRAVVQHTKDTPQDTLVEVEWRIDGYIQRDLSGQIIETVEARTELLQVALTETAEGWRLRSVEAL